MPKAVLALLLLVAGLIPQLPSAFPRDGAKQLIDNERVTVWDATWPKGKPTAMHQNKFDTVTIELANATARVTPKDGKAQSTSLNFGEATLVPKGTAQTEEGTSEPPRHAIVIDLKDTVVPPLENKSGYPEAFPRDGSKKVLDNKRITIWDYTFTLGKKTPMHFHSRDVVTIYMETGEVRSTSLDGTVVNNSVTPGTAKFNPRNRTHSEELIKGSSRVIVVELK